MGDTKNFRGTKNLYAAAKAGGFWDGVGAFHYQRALAPDADLTYEPEMNMYDSLRVWRVFDVVAPDSNHRPSRHITDFPFSIKAEKRLSLRGLQELMRDTYEGTEFDMRLGVLAGPWGSTRRFGPSGNNGGVTGQYARSISVSWSAYTFIAQPSVKHPVLWYAADSAATSVFVPFYCSVLQKGGN